MHGRKLFIKDYPPQKILIFPIHRRKWVIPDTKEATLPNPEENLFKKNCVEILFSLLLLFCCMLPRKTRQKIEEKNEKNCVKISSSTFRNNTKTRITHRRKKLLRIKLPPKCVAEILCTRQGNGDWRISMATSELYWYVVQSFVQALDIVFPECVLCLDVA